MTRLERQEWWDHRRETIGVVVLYLCFLAYVPTIIALVETGHSWLWVWLLAIPAYIGAWIQGDSSDT